jgi:hypothetical protein
VSLFFFARLLLTFFADDGISVGLADGGEDMDMKDWNATIIGPTRVCLHLSQASSPSTIRQIPAMRMWT